MSGNLVSKIIALTDNMWAVLDAANKDGSMSRQAFIEEILKQHPKVKQAAKRLRIKIQDRPERGKYERKDNTA